MTFATANPNFHLFDASTYFVGTQANNRESQFNVLDDVSINHGGHQLKFGVDYRLLNYHQNGIPAWVDMAARTTQGFTSSGDINQLFYEEFKTGTIESTFFSLYGQDSWRITRRLNLTYGLRWEFNPAPIGLASNSNAPGRKLI